MRLLILSLALFLLLPYAQSAEYELVLSEAVPGGSSQGDLPLHVLLREEKGVITEGYALALYTEGHQSYSVDVSAMRLNQGQLSGQLATTIDDHAVSATVNVQVAQDGDLVGVYTTTPERVRSVEGRVRPRLDLQAPSTATLFLLPGIVNSSRNRLVVCSFKHGAGTVDQVSVRYSELLNTLYGGKTGLPQQTPFVNADGVSAAHMGGQGDAYSFTVNKHQINITESTLNGEISVEMASKKSTVSAIYRFTGQIVAGYVFGNATIIDGAGGETVRTIPFTGHIASAIERTLVGPIPPFPVGQAKDSEQFAPPYFPDVSQEQFYQRLRGAALWFGQSAYIGAFMCDATAAMTNHTNNKQYDNGSENTYGGVMGMLMLHRLSEDPLLADQGLRAAQRAGYWSQSRGKGPYNMMSPYKGEFWTTIFQGWAFLELYLQTGEEEWRANTLRYADGLKQLQEKMFEQTKEKGKALSGNDIGGTWTYYTPSSGYVMGQSNSRKDRSRDWEPIQCGEMLYFLGRLRVEGGINDYHEVERQAYAWMVANLENDWTWHTKNTDGQGPSAFLLYLVRYADEVDEDTINAVLQYVETHYTDWSLDPERLAPAISYKPKRRQANDGAEASSTLRMALVHLALAERRNNPAHIEAAKALIYSVLSRQNSFGYIHHNGLQFTSDGAEVSFRARYKERFGHAYAVLSAETLNLLHQCYKEMARRGLFAGGSVVSTQLDADTTAGQAPLTVSFDASASQGRQLRYQWDFGDGQQSSEAKVRHQFDIPGNYLVTLDVRSGDTVDRRQIGIRVR